MKQTKQIKGRYRFTIARELASKVLFLNGYRLAHYPLTYEIIDCLEHFCDGVSWEVVTFHHLYRGLNLTDGMVTLLRPREACTFAETFHKARRLYREEFPR